MKVNILHSQMMKPLLTKRILIFIIIKQNNSQVLILKNRFFKVQIKNLMALATILLCKSIILKTHFYKKIKEFNNSKLKKFKNKI